ncbi:MAG: NADH-quinone oxidoreductase subunit NuoF [Anaerolineae bacterium]|jgi:NADH-quinone oxidoreductase subunit F|nr:NADH-quinone oxidoreductase subunit NuoF [Anaerolineae bacterium]MBT7072330.1 NADH-quinone oxidoreductase subunit NuoF [Anaerolineae bacterium]MBT7326050.1 NADH-quinone oxidoreductase subunit NuoF [Anaerolineae bacterium]
MFYMLLRHRDVPDINQIDVYQKNGGFDALKKAIKMDTTDVTNEVKAAGLRGRGGAGFPAGVKWSFMDNNNWPHYVVANADESEPGTFKDREIMESNPFQFLEGISIASYAVGANAAYIYLRGEFWEVAHFLDEKIEEMEKAGFLGEKIQGTDYSLKIYTHLGAGAYICGEETALLESMEGKRGQPRVRPPFPPSQGLYNKPTVVNNVETLTSVPYIISNGADGYRKFGTEKSPGTKIFSLSGNVNNPGNYELPLGTTFRELIFTHGGGIPDGKSIKAIMPAGASSSLIVANDEALDTPMDYENVRNVGADLGSASVIVVDDSIGLDWLINKTMSFFEHESCGKCTPCREGAYWMHQLTKRIHAGEGTKEDVELLKDVATQVQGKTLCALGEFSTMAVVSSIERFPEDFEAKV